MHAGMRGREQRSGIQKARDIEIVQRGHTKQPDASLRGDKDFQIVTSPSCSSMSFTFASPSSVGPSLFPPAAAAKLNVERMLATGLCVAWGEGGSERSPLRATGGDRGAPLRSVPWRELLRDMECWPTRSLVASRSLSRRSAITFSLTDTSTGLERNRPVSARKTNGREGTELGCTKGARSVHGVTLGHFRRGERRWRCRSAPGTWQKFQFPAGELGCRRSG
jgi:hypothetical protein